MYALHPKRHIQYIITKYDISQLCSVCKIIFVLLFLIVIREMLKVIHVCSFPDGIHAAHAV
jgi:hypothetical protein